MVTKIKGPDAGTTYVNVQQFLQGGTGQTTASAALQALNGIPASQVGEALGPVDLRADGTLDPEYLSGLSLTDTAVDGPITILTGESRDFFLTTYDVFTDYTLEALMGVVTRKENVITYTAGNVAGLGGFSINGRQILVTIVSRRIERPVIVTPASGAIDTAFTLTITTSPFESTGVIDAHESTDWELATDVAFQHIVDSSYNDTVNKTAWEVTLMDELTTYYARCRFKGTLVGLSPWSAATTFTTGNDGLINTEVAKIVAPDGVAGDNFGRAVAVSWNGQRLFIGAVARSEVSPVNGVVYVYERGAVGYEYSGKIYPPTAAEQFRFGNHLATNGDGTILLVARGASTVTPETGVHYYRLENGEWLQKGVIVETGPDYGSWLGNDCVLNEAGDFAIISILGSQGIDNGGFYTFTRSGDAWTQQSFTAVFPTGVTGRGLAMTPDCNYLAIAVQYPDDSGDSFIRFFARSGYTWTFTGEEIGRYGTSGYIGSSFGISLAISEDGNTLYVSNLRETVNGQQQAGVIHVYHKDGGNWSLTRTLQASDASVNAYFGQNISLVYDYPRMVVGAGGDNGFGAVYIFD